MADHSAHTKGGGTSVSAFAPAKVNLYLHVTGRRPDGFHLLDMLIVFAGVGDKVTATQGDGLSLSVSGPFGAGIPTDDGNLVMRAARSLADLCGIQPHAAIHLEKNLPPSSGIGGGSADAAATLRALSELWSVTPPPERLDALALSLGADVPMCLKGEPAFASGVGEDLRPAPPLPPCWMVLVNPGIPVSTPAVFRNRTPVFRRAAPFTERPENAAALAALLSERTNDLSDPARELAPEIGKVLATIESTDGVLLGRMSGSGATCFGLYADRNAAEDAARALGRNHSTWWIAAAPVLGTE